ncbi:MAG: NADH-quinone oxidoreductase subunit A [Solirubrobacteraceae bacterium]|nr:NADH-quinone oxidoreductase subunit A [Solirubrobacteraceae bacterium]
MLQSYLPALVFIAVALLIGITFVAAGAVIGPKRAMRQKTDSYECGLPSDVKSGFRFGVSFYLVAMLFILFDIEVIFLYPIAVQLGALGVFALIEVTVFIGLLSVALIYVWRRGALEWK